MHRHYLTVVAFLFHFVEIFHYSENNFVCVENVYLSLQRYRDYNNVTGCYKATIQAVYCKGFDNKVR